MKLFYLVFSFLLFASISYSNDVYVANAIPSSMQPVQSDSWGSDITVSTFKPIGPMSGIRGANGHLYLAVNDTLATANMGLVVYRSTNSGLSWSLMPQGISSRTHYPRVKMIAAGDSVLCFFSALGNIYRWNVNTGVIAQFTINPGTDFDVVSSSTNSIYIYYITPAFALHRHGSTDYGLTWGALGNVSSNRTSALLTKSATGDTIVVNYRGNTNPIKELNEVYSFRYRETAPGTLAVTGSSINVSPAGTFRSEFKTVFIGSNMWFIYTEGNPGSRDLYYKHSANNGAAFGSATLIHSSPTRDEYWINAMSGTGSTFTGVDLVYMSDSTGGPTVSTEALNYTSANVSNPTSFASPFTFNEFPSLADTASKSSPELIEFPGQSNVGIAYVGTNGRIYWDTFSPVTSINDPSVTAESFELKQNYPNPFNPVTNISFSIPKNGLTTLKVYDMLGKEISSIVNRELTAGSYSISFNASKLSSGVYFYTLISNGLSVTKKMMVVK